MDIVDEYKYLGITFCSNGSFYKARTKLVEQGNRAMFALLNKCRSLHLPLDMQIDLLDKTVSPILLYGSEVWGYENIEILERLRLKFCKYILNVKTSTPTNMVMGELGIFPLETMIRVRMVKFWCNLLNDVQNKYSSLMYKILYNLHSSIVNEKNEKKLKRFSTTFK